MCDQQRLKETCLELLREIDRICRKNGIRYYLYGGTLLGAVRHQGFIPWDDDIDIVMFPEDYKRFEQACAEQLSQPYFLQTYQSDPLGLTPWAKLHNDDTAFISSWVRHGAHQGVFVDIFVFHSAPASRATRRIYGKTIDWMNQYMNYRFCRKVEHPSWKLKLLFGFIRLTSFIPEQRVKRFYQRYIARYDRSNGELIFHNSFRKFTKKLVRREWFRDTAEFSFEGYSFLGPAQWKPLLARYYGADYMRLPPKEQQVSVHGTEVIDLNQSWRVYQ